MKTNKGELAIPNELVDEIVDEILSETTDKTPQPENIKKPRTEPRKPESEELLDSDAPDFIKLKSRLQYLENRIEKHVHDYKTTAIEVERQIAEKFSELDQGTEKQLIYLQGQLEALRTAMIKLSNEFKQSKENISPQKQ